MLYSQRLMTALIVVFIWSTLNSTYLVAQKNNNRQDEKRENERVRNAERELSESRKQLSQQQAVLKSALRKLDASQDKLAAAKKALREAEDLAEAELGESIGIPEAIAKVNQLRRSYDEISKPVLDQLHARPEWKTLEAQVTKAKAERELLREVLELEEAQRGERLKAYTQIIDRPFEVESKALQASLECVTARQQLDQASAELAALRKKLTPGAVDAHPKVVAALKVVNEIEAVVRTDEKETATHRASATKAQRGLGQAQSALTKARQADQKDSNKDNNGKKK